MTHAIVIGGSIAGMCAAQVLRSTYDRVTLVERDVLEVAPAARRGVPQARHPHALLVRGRRELEKIFPGFNDAARRLGAAELDFGTAFLAFRPRGWEPRAPTGMLSIWASRDVLEAAVRERMRAMGTVELVIGASVTGLVVERATGDRGRAVRGVTLRDADGTERTIAGDLVVDAAGRASKTLEWLRAFGVESPEESVVDSFAGYSSLWMRAPSAEARARWGGWRGIWIDGDPPHVTRGAVLFPIEGDRCIVTMAGFARDYPPTEEGAFRAALKTLRSPILAEVTEGCEALSPVHSSRSMANRLRHYEQWRNPPAGFLAIGDSVTAFNPVYGQGMTTSAVSASILAESLRAHGTDPVALPRAFFRAQARFLAEPWAMATGADFTYPTTTGKRPLIGHVLHPYLFALMNASLEDEVVRQRLIEVFNLIRPASSLFDLRLAGRALLHTAKRTLRDRLSKAPMDPRPPLPA